jgi:hypothetical protein
LSIIDPVGTWEKYLSFEEKTAPFHYEDPLWTYDNGILVFPSAASKSYALYDLGSSKVHNIDLETDNKILRRMRLKNGVLIVEWSEDDSYHRLNETENVHRHFATAYDMVKDTESGNWRLILRYVSLRMEG